MTAHVIRWETWTLTDEADRRFRRICAGVAVPAIALLALLTLWQIELPERPAPAYNGSRQVELLPQEQAPLAPKQEQPKPAEKNQQQPPQQAKAKPAEKPVQKPVETPKPVVNPRDIAQKTQEMQAIQNTLNDLRQQNLAINDKPLVTPVIGSKGGIGASGETISASAAANSGGIGGTGSVSSTQSGVGLGTRHTATVQSTIGNNRPRDSGDRAVAARSLQELQEVFDRNKAGFYAIYNRAARDNPNIAEGKIVVTLTISPDGSVTHCAVVSSTFNDPEFEHKVVERILLLRFAAKSVPAFTYPNYPIEFHPM